MTTTQPAALPELPMPDLYAHELILNGGGVWLGVPEKGICEQAHIEGETGEEIREFYTADQMRARDGMWAERLAALQPQPAAAVSDAEIERIFKKCGGKWNGDHWVIEDADIHPAIREFLALRPQAVPSLDTLKQHLACDIECSVYENTVLPAIERWECHHGITAQGAQGEQG